MNGHVGRSPKALLELGGESLVQPQIRSLRRAGVNDIALVVGSQAAAVRHHCGEGVTCVENERHAETNGLTRCGWHGLCCMTDASCSTVTCSSIRNC